MLLTLTLNEDLNTGIFGISLKKCPNCNSRSVARYYLPENVPSGYIGCLNDCGIDDSPSTEEWNVL